MGIERAAIRDKKAAETLAQEAEDRLDNLCESLRVLAKDKHTSPHTAGIIELLHDAYVTDPSKMIRALPPVYPGATDFTIYEINEIEESPSNVMSDWRGTP